MTKDIAPIKVRVNSRAMKSMFTNSDIVLAWLSEMRMRKGSDAAI